MSDENNKCIVCQSDLLIGSKKCLACGSRQDWLRFFDFGNTSLSMLIAAFSVLALGADNIIKLTKVFQDSEKATVTIKVSSIDPNELTIFLDNDGPGNAVFSGSSLCSIYPTAKALDLFKPLPNTKDSFSGIRYPNHKEVIGHYFYLFGNKKPLILKAGENRIITLKFRDIKLSTKEKIRKKTPDVIKSYCSFSYLHENGNEDGFFETLDSLQVTYFALDNEGVKKILANFRKNLLSE